MEKGLRAPIVCVLGHVDHGKTTLLDAIRKSNVAGREAGGITQAIGASTVTTKEGKKITFIDTPGHAAFGKMRSRGANVADITILVVAADDGVAPQTKEALEIIRGAKVPFIVTITKTDLPSASTESVLGQLGKEGVLFEGRGGDTPYVPVSAKKGEGIEHLLEMITLFAEMHEVKGDPGHSLEAVVIETSKDKRGDVASIVVRNGSIKIGSTIYIEGKATKVRGLFDDKGKGIREVLPGQPAAVIGFEGLPPVGTKVFSETSETMKEPVPGEGEKIGKLKEGQIPVFIKAKSKGALEAILASLPENIIVINSGVGEVKDSDVLWAKASDSIIFAFESEVSSSTLKLAETDGVRIERFEIIYELIQRLEELIKKSKIEILGKAEIIASFPFNNKKVAGCKVLQGKISKADRLVVTRADKELGNVKVVSIRKQRQEAAEVKAGEEFGIVFEPQLDFAIGDVILSVKK